VTGQVSFFFYSASGGWGGIGLVAPVICAGFAVASAWVLGIIPASSKTSYMLDFWVICQLLFVPLIVLALNIRDWLARRALVVRLKRVLNGTEKY
jgi:hypothetical protein